MDPKTKIITQKIQISLANNSYEKLQNDEDATPTKYESSWLLDTAASGNYADWMTIIRNRKAI